MTKVLGFAHGSNVLVWSAEDVVRLDRDWRICSGLVGALPGKPRQNIQLGLPFKLSSEETTLLIEKGALELLEYFPPSHTQEDIETFHQNRELEFQAQFASYLEEREQARVVHTGIKSCAETSQPKKAKLDYREHPSFSPLVSIPTADNWPISNYQQYTNWTYPATKQEKYRYLIYKDLWECGYTLTTGLKFGGDYLVYKGHPHTVHASFIAVVLPWKQTIRSFGAVTRVGTKVKKSILLCSMDEEGMVHYLTVDWSM